MLNAWALMMVAVGVASCDMANASDGSAEIAADIAEVHVHAAADTVLRVDGVDRGREREFTFRDLKPEPARLATFETVSPNGTFRRDVLLMPGERVSLSLDDVNRPELVLQTGHTTTVATLAFSPGGKYLFSGADGGVVMWDVAGGRQLRTFRPEPPQVWTSLRFATETFSLAVTPDGKHLLAGMADECAYTWDVESGNRVAISQGWYSGARAAISRDGRRRAITCFTMPDDDLAQLEGVRDNFFARCLWPKSEPGPFNPSGLCYSHDDSTTAIVGLTMVLPTQEEITALMAAGKIDQILSKNQYLLLLWNANDGRLRHRIRAHDDEITAVAASPIEDLVATASKDDTVALWNTTDGKLRQRWKLAANVTCIAFDSAGKRLLAACVMEKEKRTTVTAYNVVDGNVIESWSIHQPAHSIACSPDDQTFAVGLRNGAIELRDATSGKVIRTFHSRIAPVESLAVDRESKHIATGGRDGANLLWPLAGSSPRSLAAGGFHFDRLAFDRTGTRLAAASFGDLACWNVLDGQPVWRNAKGEVWYRDAAFSGDGTRLLVGGNRHPVKNVPGYAPMLQEFDAATGKILRDFAVPSTNGSTSIDSVAWTADGKTAAAGFCIVTNEAGKSSRGTWLIDGVTGETKKTIREGTAAGGIVATTGHVAFGRHDARLLSGAWELWNHRAGQQTATVEGHHNQIQDLAVTPDGRRLLTVSWDGDGAIWDIVSGRQLLLLRGHQGEIECCAITADGKFCATGGHDGRVNLWNIETGERLRTLQVDEQRIWDVAFSPDGKLLAAASHNRTVVVWRTFSGFKERTLTEDRPMTSVCFSPDGTKILAGCGNKTAVLWNRDGGEKLLTFRGHTDAVRSIAFSADGRRIVTGSLDKTAMIWNAETAVPIHTLSWHSDFVSHVEFSADGSKVLTACSSNPMMLWDAAKGTRIRSFKSSSTFGVSAAAFMPDGKELVTGSLDRQSVRWNMARGERLQTYGAPVLTTTVDASNNGRYVVVGTMVGEIKLYDATTGRKLHDFARQASKINTVRFLAEGRYVASAQEDGTTRLWDIATGRELASLVMLDGGREWLVITPDGRFDASPGGKEIAAVRIGKGLEVQTLANSTTYARPGLLATLLSGKLSQHDDQ
jgi:WD40 repeat protein